MSVQYHSISMPILIGIVYNIFLMSIFNFLFLLLKYTITCIIHDFFANFTAL